MKMKKVLAMLLCAMMICTCIPTLAATTLTLEQNFDDMAVGPTTAEAVKNNSSEIWDDTSLTLSGADALIVNDGYFGNSLHLKRKYATASLVAYLRKTTPETDNPVNISFKMKIVNDGDRAAEFQIALGSDWLAVARNGRFILVNNSDSANQGFYQENVWYNVQIVRDVTNTTITISDENGFSISGYRAAGVSNSIIQISDANGVIDAEIAIDEISINQGTAEGTPALEEKTDGEEVVAKAPLYDVVMEENFDSYNKTGLGEALNSNGEWAALGNYTLSWEEGDGKGGDAPILENNSSNAWTTIADSNSTGTTWLSLRFKIKEGGRAYIGADATDLNNKTWFWIRQYESADDLQLRFNGKSKLSYDEEVWYSIVWSIENLNDGNEKLTAYLYDADNNLVYTGNDTKAAGTYLRQLSVSTYGTGYKVAIDDVKVLHEKTGASDAEIINDILGAAVPYYAVVDENFNSFDNTTTFAALQTQLNNKGTWETVGTSTISWEDNDCNGGEAPKIKTSSGDYDWMTISDTDTTGKTWCSMRLKMFEGSALYVGNDSYSSNLTTASKVYFWIRNGKFEPRSITGASNTAYTNNLWYTLMWSIEDNGTGDKLNFKVFNDSKVEILSGTETFNERIPRRVSFYTHATDVAVDDIKVLHAPVGVSDENMIDYILGNPVSESAESLVYTVKPAIGLRFSKPISASSTASFVSGGSTVPATIKYAGSNVISIVPSTALAYDTEYTLALTGVKGLDNSPATETLKIKTMPFSTGTMTAGASAFTTQGGYNCAEVPVTFTNAQVDEFNGTVIGAFYEDNVLQWAGICNLTGKPVGEPATIRFSNLPDNVDNTSTFRIFSWENFETLRPVYTQVTE